jgi:hypothetical protein
VTTARAEGRRGLNQGFGVRTRAPARDLLHLHFLISAVSGGNWEYFCLCACKDADPKSLSQNTIEAAKCVKDLKVISQGQ